MGSYELKSQKVKGRKEIRKVEKSKSRKTEKPKKHKTVEKSKDEREKGSPKVEKYFKTFHEINHPTLGVSPFMENSKKQPHPPILG